MTDEEFRQLKRRFGDDVETWPAPYRLLARKTPADSIERMVREAALEGIDDRFLSRSVLDGLKADRGRRFHGLRSAVASPRLVVATALVLAGTSMLGGFQFARMEGGSVEVSMFAIAAGMPTTILLGDDIRDPESSL